MKAEFLKLAGVKTEKAFYKKYPTEAAFFKAHPEAKKMIKKAQVGADVNANGIPDYLEVNPSLKRNQFMKGDGSIGSFYQTPDAPTPYPGTMFKPATIPSVDYVNLPKPSMDMSDPEAPMFQNINMPVTEDTDFMNQVTEANIPDVQPLGEKDSSKNFGEQFNKYAPYVGQLIGGIQNLKAQRQARKSAEQWRDVSGLVAQASGLRETQERRYVRPEDNMFTTDQFFPSQGVGTNVLTAQNGIEMSDDEGYDLIDKYRGYDSMVRDIESRGSVPVVKEEEQIVVNTPTQSKPSKKIDENSARDIWVEKTGLPWSEAKKRGYTDGSFNSNVNLLNRLRTEKVSSILANPKTSGAGNKKSNVQQKQSVDKKEASKNNIPQTKQKSSAQKFKKMSNEEYRNYGSQVRPLPEADFYDRTVELLAHPVETFGHYAKYRELPASGFSRGEGNAYDDVIGTRNPAYWLSKGVNAARYTGVGEFKKALQEAIGAIGALQLVKHTKYLPLNPGIPQNATVRSAGRLPKSSTKKLPGRQLPAERLPDGVIYYRDGGEIQNTYAPGYLYDDLGYEPLDESSIVKQYAYGGGVPKAEGGFSAFMTSGGGDMLGNLAGYATGNNAGGQIGGAIGGGLGTVFGGPVGGAIGNTIGTLAGGLLDTNAKRQKKAQAQMMRNLNSAAMSQGAQSLQQQYSGFMEDGGQITNPQLITKFGEYSVKDLLVPPHDADMLRAGGNLRSYTPVSERGLSTMEEGGDLQTHWGGYAEPISQNPYLPANGETVMFRGQSHDESDGYGNTGIGITYGNSPVEVERGEPAIQLQEPNGETNLTVFGNLKIPSAYVPILGDEKAKGKKFKNYVAELSKQEKRQNNVVEKSTSLLDNLELNTSFDKLKMASAEASILGANMKLKDIADKKINAAALQSSINDTAEEYGLDADALARGKVKIDSEISKQYAKLGKSIRKAQAGTDIPEDQYGLEIWEGNQYDSKGRKLNKKDKRTASEFSLKEWNQVAKKYGFKGRGNKEFQEFLMNHPEASRIVKKRHDLLYGSNPQTNPDLYDSMLGRGWAAPELLSIPEAAKVPAAPAENKKKEEDKDKTYGTIDYKRNVLADIYNQVLPFLRPTDQEELDGMQLAGEMYALSTNQLEPVQAQTFQPELGVPYDISLQDQLNANQADYRAAQRMVGYNPAAQAMLNAQKYEANQKVLGEQFRMNQAMRDQVYNANRNILNDAKLKNLAIYDQQYQRQAHNTKATTQAALNSIASKYAQNKLENRTLATYENLYNYRFDPSGRAINMNPLFQANMPSVYGKYENPDMIPVVDDKGNVIKYIQASSQTEVAKNGSKTKKNYSQSSIVRAFK